MDKLERIACLYLAFLNHSGLSFSQIRSSLADAYVGEPETVRRKFERDKDKLRELGLDWTTIKPGEYLPNGNIAQEFTYFLKDEPLTLPEIHLSKDESHFLSGLVLAYLGNQQNGHLSLAEQKTLESAIQKIFYSNPSNLMADSRPELPRTLAPLMSEQHSNAHFFALEIVHAALQKKKVLHFQYKNKLQQRSSRRVWPHGLISRQSRWCMIAWCLDAKEYRYFYLDQMSELQIQQKGFQVRSDFAIEEFNLHPLSLQYHGMEKISFRYHEDAYEQIMVFFNGLPKRYQLQHKDNNTIVFHTTNKAAFFNYVVINFSSIHSIGPQSILDEYKSYVQTMRIKNDCGAKLKDDE